MRVEYTSAILYGAPGAEHGAAFVAVWTDENEARHQRNIIGVQADGSIITFPEATRDDLVHALGWIAERFLQPLRRI